MFVVFDRSAARRSKMQPSTCMAALFAGFIDGPMARQRPAPFLCNGFLPGSYTTSGHVVRGLAALSMSAGWNSVSIKLANAACCVDSAMGERQLSCFLQKGES